MWYDCIVRSKPIYGTNMSPTSELYAALEKAFDHFNASLFEGKLPRVIFSIQRQQSVMGYYSHKRWASQSNKYRHEIAINPSYVGRSSLIELFQTLVHEMTHEWQFKFGKPSRRSYHNRQFANKMKAIGLMPSTTGDPGGATTGEKMNDYAISNGKFIRECANLVSKKSFQLPWVDRYARVRNMEVESYDVPTSGSEEGDRLGIRESIFDHLTSLMSDLYSENTFVDNQASAAKKAKVRYSCEGCGINLWGKSGLDISCNSCELTLV